MDDLVIAVLVMTIVFGPLPLNDGPGFVCPDHSVVVLPDQCAASGNRFAPPPNPVQPFPGSGGGGSGGLLGFLHKLTGGLL